MKIAVLGLGYVGLANALLLSEKHNVSVYDPDTERVSLISARISPIKDDDISEALKAKVPFKICPNIKEACKGAAYIIVAVPTNSAGNGLGFDTSILESVVADICLHAEGACVVIRSTLPIGMTDSLAMRYPRQKFFFMPEFCREGFSLYDSRNPSRVIIGTPHCEQLSHAETEALACLYKKLSAPGTSVMMMGAAEAEAVKLFSNSYLAMRVAFFNELDTFSERSHLDSAQIINGMTSDPRIGGNYNNPSFGYGGNCLPKDLAQLVKSTSLLNLPLLHNVEASNTARKKHIVAQIKSLLPAEGFVGIYRMTMKSGSDNFRSSAVLSVIDALRREKIPVLIYEPLYGGKSYMGIPVTDDLGEFKAASGIIVANRISAELSDVADKLYTRDLFSKD